MEEHGTGRGTGTDHSSSSLTTALETLRRQHHALYPIYQLHLPTSLAPDLATEQSQGWLIGHILDDPVLEGGRRPEGGYERKFWRKLVGVLEDGVRVLRHRGDDVEVDSRVYEHLTHLMVSDMDGTTAPSQPGSSDGMPGQTHRTFVYDLPRWSSRYASPSASRGSRDPEAAGREGSVTLLEEQMAIQGGTTGLRTWTASLHLGQHILQCPSIFFPPSPEPRQTIPLVEVPPVLELGAGTGFLSVLLSQLGSPYVIATDLGDTSPPDHPAEYCRQTPLSRLEYNVHLNRGDAHQGRLAVRHLDWMEVLNPPEERSDAFKDLEGEISALSQADEIAWGSRNTGMTIMAADVIYDPDLVPALVKTIRHLLELIVAQSEEPRSSPPPTDHSSLSTEASSEPHPVVASTMTYPVQAIVAATVRNAETLQLFEKSCEKEGMTVRDLDLEPIRESNQVFWNAGLDQEPTVRIMRMTLKTRV